MKIIKPEEQLPPKNLVVVIYGPPGVAKTSLAFTANKPILFDFDEGVHRAEGRKDINKPEHYEDIVEMIEKDELRDKGYETGIIDTGGGCIDNFIADYVCRKDFKNRKGDGSLSLSGYGAAGVVFTRLVNYIKSCKMELVIICHGVEKEGAGDSLRVRPKLTGGSYNMVMAVADMVGYMEMRNDKSTLNFNPTDKHIGKNSGELAPVELPHYNTQQWQGFLASLIEKTKNKIEAMSDIQVQAMKTIEEYRNEIMGMDKPEQFQSISERMKPLPEYCRIVLKKVMGDRMKEVLVRWNKEMSVFEVIPEPAVDVVKPEPVSATESVFNLTDKQNQSVIKAFMALGLQEKALEDAKAQVLVVLAKGPVGITLDDAIDEVIVKMMETVNPTGQP